MNEHTFHQHIGAETLQAFLEGRLPTGERQAAQEHLASCARCSAELDGWKLLFDELDQLPSLTPSSGFADAVMAEVHMPEALPLAARIRGWVGLASPEGHLSDERLQDFVEGLLPARHAARVRTHLDGCPRCAGDAAALETTIRHLAGLEHHAPSQGFAARVMAQVHVPAPAPAKVPEWRRALAWAGRLVPHTRKAWAALSGVAVTPVATLGLVVWTVFSHPTLTPGALASFAWWKATEAAGLLWQAVSSAALESASVFKLYSLLESLAVSPAAMAGAFVALSLATVAAVWVLYRNLIVSHPVDGRIAHAPLS